MLSFHDVVVADLIYISKERAALITEKNLQGAPDLVIEISSPSTRPRDERLKRDLYERAGVREHWLVDPATDVVTVHRRAGDAYEGPIDYGKNKILVTSLLPGLELPLERIFKS